MMMVYDGFHNNLVGGFGTPTPLDDDCDEIPKYSQLFLESHNPFMFQSPPGIITPKAHTTGGKKNLLWRFTKPQRLRTTPRATMRRAFDFGLPLSEAFLSIKPLSTTFWVFGHRRRGRLREISEKSRTNGGQSTKRNWS